MPRLQAAEPPPILSYDGYAFYNWKRFLKGGPITLGNIDAVQNFVHLYDEHWFILVHVEIEAIAARILDAIATVQAALDAKAPDPIDDAVRDIVGAINEQVRVLRRIEKMDPALYYKTFRPYIRFIENVEYEADVAGARVSAGSAARLRISFRGETGAQSSIMPLLVAFMKIPHRTSMLTAHLLDLRNYMPAEHRALIAAVEAMPNIRVAHQVDLAGIAEKQTGIVRVALAQRHDVRAWPHHHLRFGARAAVSLGIEFAVFDPELPSPGFACVEVDNRGAGLVRSDFPELRGWMISG